jgi:predicted metalloprotease
MSFNDDARLDTSQVTGRRGRGGVVVGGGVVSLVVLLVAVFLGVDPGSIGTDQGGAFDTSQVDTSGEAGVDVSACRTGADANRDDTCRVVGTVNSVQDYWEEALPADAGQEYRPAQTVLFSGTTASACGTASARTGPFYCPADEKVYLDASFFDQLTSRFGADDGALAQEYVVAHEYGHHVQQLLGVLGRAQGGGSGAEGGGVRTELMADCLAGVWAHHASSTQDAEGTTLLEPLSDADVRSALSAAAAVGDDHLQRSAGASVDPDSWTHGSSAQRQRWFLAGYDAGTAERCDTFATDEL